MTTAMGINDQQMDRVAAHVEHTQSHADKPSPVTMQTA